ncbi:MAG: nuclear transport factor 2 family protein [Acidimicrobiia bacterium]|nr:nuclear transport factor 2 family protein [Acidimicrobiia bacterium]
MTGTVDEIAERLFTSIEKGDVEAVRALYAPDAVVWHNDDGVEQTVEQNLEVLGWVIDNLAARSYDEVRRQATASGFVQQHVLRFTKADGSPQEIPACLVVACDLEAGTITRIDEYLDSAHVTARILG